MHTSRGPTRPRLLALALILAFFPALLFYLLVLQLPFFSYSRLALAALSLPVFAWPMYLALSRPGAASWQRWIQIGLGSAVLALFGLQAISFFPGKLYPFYEKHTLSLTAPSTGFEIRGFMTSLGPVGYSSFQGLEGWERRGGRLIPLSTKAGPLQWSGWTGDSVRLDVSGEPGTALELTWKSLADLAQGKTAEEPESFTSRMVDRIGLLAPRLAAAKDEELSGIDALKDLRVSMDLAVLQDIRGDLPPPAQAMLEQLLQGVGHHYSARSADKQPKDDRLLPLLDHTVSMLSVHLPAHATRPLAALVGLRRNLFPLDRFLSGESGLAGVAAS